MKRNISISLIFFILLISLIACGKKDIKTKDDVIKFVEEKGKDNVEFKDFKHLEHIKEDEEVFSSVKYIYRLENNAKLLLDTIGSDGKKPSAIILIDGEKEIKLK